jgi:hypothetical protein
MSDPDSRLPARPSLEQLQKQAKELLRGYRAGESTAAERFRAADPSLADAQFIIAREHGFESWARLKHYIEAELRPNPAQYQRVVQDLLEACRGDAAALQRIHDRFGIAFTQASTPFNSDQLRTYVQERLKAIPGEALHDGEITVAGAQLFLARQYGLKTWANLMDSVAKAPADPRQVARGISGTPPFYKIDWKENTIHPGPVVSVNDWDAVFAVMKEHGITGLNAEGRMTDDALERLCRLEHITRLNLDGSVRLTDDGLVHLARLPHLQQLDLSGWKGQLTDRGLDVLRHLKQLRRFQICWQQNVSDAGMANLSFCEHLEIANLMGTPAGDQTIRALGGKRKLRHFNTGRGVTDRGIPLLHEIPMFKTWHGGDTRFDLMSFEAEPTFLLLDGPFTNAGLDQLAGLDGLFGLSFFWHCPDFTSAGLAQLKDLANLGFLGCQDAHCDDEAMRHIAAIPKLRMLMGQGAVASDAGWEALSRSRTIEYIWGRDCPNLGGRGFTALAAMPALRGLGVSCRGVDDAALSTLPHFPALRQLMPMDVTDDGFRHVGRCEQLENLWCMYCRDTGDTATEHIAGLSKLKSYYAGKTLITDRSLEIIGQMESLERLEFWRCGRLTDAGVAHLATLPRLREVTLDGSPAITQDAVSLFPDHVRVNYST